MQSNSLNKSIKAMSGAQDEVVKEIGYEIA